jgi:hypothetical protein
MALLNNLVRIILPLLNQNDEDLNLRSSSYYLIHHARRARLCMYSCTIVVSLLNVVHHVQLYLGAGSLLNLVYPGIVAVRSSTKFSIPGYSSRILVRSCSEHIRMYIILQGVSNHMKKKK